MSMLWNDPCCGWRRLRHAGFMALLVLCLRPAAPAAGQALVSGSLEGTVRDMVDRPMFSVTITVTSRATGRRWIVRSDRSGRYAIESLAAGQYDALFERLGFDPERIEDIGVNPGERRDIPVRLLAAEGPAVRTRVRVADPSLGIASQSGPERWTTGAAGTASLPYDASDLAAVTRTSSVSGPRLDVAGLPFRMQTILIDGIPSAQRLNALAFRARAAAFPIASLSMAQLIDTSPDVEYPGTSGTFLAGATRPAGATVLRAWADGGTDALALGAEDVAAFQTWRVGALAGGAIVRDTAAFLVGAEYSKAIVPYVAVWLPDAAGTAIEDAARQRYGVDLASWSRPALETSERVSGFARLDLRIGDNSTLNLRGLFATQPATSWMLPTAEQPVGAALSGTATDLFGGLTVQSSFAEGMAFNELNVGFEMSRMERDPGAGATQELPATSIADAARAWGEPSSLIAESRVWSAYARDAITLPLGGHRVKIGVAFTLPSYNLTELHGTAGTLHYSGTDDFNAGNGYYAGLIGTSSQRDWTENRIVLFAQDAWKPSPDVEIVAGARLSIMKNLDSLNVRLEDRWQRLTGLSNRTIEGANLEVEPRFMITWRPAGSGIVVSGVAQVDGQSIDPAHVAELLVRDGSLDVRRGFGRFGAYPTVPDTGGAVNQGPTVTLLGPQFQGPRSSRLTGTITKALGSVALSLSTTYRKTEFLAQRKDLNLSPVAAARDQFGRPIYGQLRKEGSILFADGESNRRFPEFDEVWGLQATGISTYRAVTISAEHALRGAIGFRATYTFSNTEDDWLLGTGGDPRSQISPFPDSLGGVDWARGRSDLDIPHRAVIGAELQVPGQYGPRLAAIYRYQSGYPFTPGYRDGVDANADGSASNDPAFLSPSIPGTSELISRWSCLTGHADAFVERNACRGPAIHALDARVTIGITSGDRHAAHVVIDAINLVAPEDIVPDRAVYLADPARDLVVSPNGRNVTVPLIANPGFGEAVARYAPQRLLRLGLRLSW